MSVDTVGEMPDGRAIQRVSLSSDALSADLLTFGAALRDLRLAGLDHPLTLGLADATEYAGTGAPYLGVIVGRMANRIARGRATIAGRRVELDRNENALTTLHGGTDGTGRRLWRLADHGPRHATFTDTLPDGHMGFPGRLEVTATYRLDGAALTLTIEATTDAPTLCNFASHAYWNLSGAPTTDDHRLQIDAGRYQSVDADNIPDGPPLPVAGTRFDLRSPAPVPAELDHNFCLADDRRAAPARALRLSAGPVAMKIATTEPGVQIYDGRALGVPAGAGLDGRGYGARSGIAIEPQAWVDAANGPARGQVDLAPGGRYRQETRFEFSHGTDGPDAA